MFLLINFCVLSITVKVLKPKKSNFIKPAFSAEYMSNCVEGSNKFEDKSLYRGTVSDRFFSAITTPAAWVATFLFNPSNLRDKSISFLTLESSFIIFWIRGSLATHSFNPIGLDGSNGIIFEIWSTKP